MSEYNENNLPGGEQLTEHIATLKEIICEIPGRRGNEALAAFNGILADLRAQNDQLIYREVEWVQINEQIRVLATVIEQQQIKNEDILRVARSLVEHLNEENAGGTSIEGAPEK
jgi:hypothetical protein